MMAAAADHSVEATELLLAGPPMSLCAMKPAERHLIGRS